LYRAVYDELGKYGSIENQLLCRQRVEEVEPMIGFCSRKLGGSSLQEDELLNMENDGPANDLLKAKMEVFLLCTALLAQHKTQSDRALPRTMRKRELCARASSLIALLA
jgi:hypothetical protein